MSSRARLVAWSTLAVLVASGAAGCVTPATEVIVEMGTNAPLGRRSLVVTVSIRGRDGGVPTVHGWRWSAGTSGPDAACHASPDGAFRCSTDAARDARLADTPVAGDAATDGAATDDVALDDVASDGTAPDGGTPADVSSTDARAFDAIDSSASDTGLEDAGNDDAPGTPPDDVVSDNGVAPPLANSDDAWSLGSFAIVRGPTTPRDGVTAAFHVVVEPEFPGDPAIEFDQTYAITFQNQRAVRMPVFLNLNCGRRATGCRTGRPEACTLGQLCTERGQTCAESGACETVDTPVMNGDVTSVPGGEVCGDAICAGRETCASCPRDCPCPPSCGDGVCNGGETCGSCARDCPCGSCSLGEGDVCVSGAGAPGCCTGSRRCATSGSNVATTCCSVAGGPCSSRGGCCGALICSGGVCQPPPTCNLAEANACTPGGSAPGCCTSGRRCAPNGTGSGNFCCADEGASCTQNQGCCGSLVCTGGRCSAPATPCAIGEGQSCPVSGSAPACCSSGRRCAPFSAGGSTFCCRDQGGACTMSTGCCGTLQCISGTCQPPPCNIGEGMACTVGAANPACCASGRTCASFSMGGSTYCCRNQGGACTMSTGCCGSLLCMSGTCQPSAVCNLAEAAACTVGATAPNCCAGGRSCGSYSAGGATHCCRNAGGACTSSLGCCGNLLCMGGTCQAPAVCSLGESASCMPGAAAPNCCASGRSCASYSSGGATFCCRNSGGACTSSTGCCGNLLCMGGTCQAPAVCSLGESAACTPGSAAPNCCSGSRSCASYSSGGATYCCRNSGGACTSSLGCCGNLLCMSGTCRAPAVCGLAEAALCTPGAAAPNCCSGSRSCASYSPGGATHCCRNAGGACTSSLGCCGALLCNAGTCR